METTTCCRCLEPAELAHSTLVGTCGAVALYWCGCQQPDAADIDERDGVEMAADVAIRDFEAVPSYFERFARKDGVV